MAAGLGLGSKAGALERRIGVADLDEARELERLRYQQIINDLNVKESDQVKKQDADFASRGLYNSGARLLAVSQARIDKLRAIIDSRLEIRKDLARSFPEFGSAQQLNTLLTELTAMLDLVQVPAELPPGATRDSAKQRLEQDIYRLKAGAKVLIEILKKECALNLHKRPEEARIVALSTGGAAIVNLGTIYGDVQQVIGGIQQSGHPELAGLLQQLTAAINDSQSLGENRKELLEQVGFIAEQVTVPAERRQLGVVKGLLIALQSGLQNAANIAGIMAVAGPAIAQHFGLQWPC